MQFKFAGSAVSFVAAAAILKKKGASLRPQSSRIHKRDEQSAFSTTVGVELENVGVTSEQMQKVVSPFGWHVTHDLSVFDDRPSWNRKEYGQYENEVVSPVLRYEQRQEASAVMQAMGRAGARVNSSCGTHVHIGAQDVKVNALLHLLHWWTTHESAIYDMLGTFEPRQLKTAKRLPPEILKTIADTRPDSIDSFKAAYREGVIAHVKAEDPFCDFVSEEIIYNAGRHWGINFGSLNKHNTVEFRAFEATMCPERLQAYIELAHGAMKGAQAKPSFTAWDELVSQQNKTVEDALQALPFDKKSARVVEHFTTMAEQTRWARGQGGRVPENLARLFGAKFEHPEEKLRDIWPAEHNLRAAHRSAEASLVGAESLSLRGLCLQSLPPCLVGMQTLRHLDLRHNQFEQVEQVSASLPAGLHSLDMRHNALPQNASIPHVPQARLEAQDMTHFIDSVNRHNATLKGNRGHNRGEGWEPINLFHAYTGHTDDLHLCQAWPHEVLAHLTEVRHLELSEYSPLTDSIGQMTALQWIEKRGTVDEIESWIGNLKDLRRLTLQRPGPTLRCPDALLHLPNFWEIDAWGGIQYRSEAHFKWLDQRSHRNARGFISYPNNTDLPTLHAARRKLMRLRGRFSSSGDTWQPYW